MCFEPCVNFLRKFFQSCFEKHIVPKQWGTGIINPIQKQSCTDSRDPTGYWGITLTSAVYKLYCSILNERLNKWVEENEKLSDCQNGFIKNRSTTDHLSTLTRLIETRKLYKKSTSTCFIDFRKVYDTVNRNLLWSKLSQLGISGKMFSNLKAIYNNVKCSVRINGHLTDWFSVNTGLKQGCLLSSVLFNLYMNDLTLALESTGLGIDIDGNKVCVLQYANDIVVMAETQQELQTLLEIVHTWCNANSMQVNLKKTTKNKKKTNKKTTTNKQTKKKKKKSKQTNKCYSL